MQYPSLLFSKYEQISANVVFATLLLYVYSFSVVIRLCGLMTIHVISCGHMHDLVVSLLNEVVLSVCDLAKLLSFI